MSKNDDDKTSAADTSTAIVDDNPTTPSSSAFAPQPSSSPPALPSVVAVDRSQMSSIRPDELLATISVKGRAAKTGYDRDQFGDAWTDDNTSPLGHNGCDTRNDILGRDLSADVYKSGTRRCVILSGLLLDPYTGGRLAFRRGPQSASVQIDHVVALSNAWQTGAATWTKTTRTAFANDPLNLLAVDGPTNEAKGDGDAATWLPPSKSHRCAYVARQVAVKARYQLWMTQAEHDVIESLLLNCPSQTVPAESGTVITKSPPKAKSKPKRTTAAPPSEAEPAPAECTRTSRGTCIHGGQFCPKDSYGDEGTDGEGRTYVCEGDTSHPHWMIS